MVALIHELTRFQKFSEAPGPDPRALKFFEHELRRACFPADQCFLVVSPLVPANFSLLAALQDAGLLAGVIPKGASRHLHTIHYLRNRGCPILQAERGTVLRQVKEAARGGGTLMLIDVGGYYARYLEALNGIGNIAGIIEDTGNGEPRYREALGRMRFNRIPVLSIAGTEIKRYEDFLIGRVIALSTITALRFNDVNLANARYGVIGFGEVGAGAAFFLRQSSMPAAEIGDFVQPLHDLGLLPAVAGPKPVLVYDHNPKVLAVADKLGFRTVDKDTLLARSSIVIGATGNKSVRAEDWRKFSPGSFFASCTSADDECDRPQALRRFSAFGNVWTTPEGVNLINGGDAANFLFPAIQSEFITPYIHLTLAGLLAAAKVIRCRPTSLNISTLNQLPSDEQRDLEGRFNAHFPERKSSREFRFLERLRKCGLLKGP